LNGRVFNSISEQYIPKAGLESTTAIELGYSGKSADRKLQYSLDGFYQIQEGMIVNFTNVGPRVSFPNIKNEIVTALTAKGISAEIANRVAIQAATQYGGSYNAVADQHQAIPLFANNTAPSSGFRNIAGKAKYFGLEGSVQYTTDNGINPFVNFSWLSDVVFDPQKLGEPVGSSNSYYLNTSPTRLRFGVNKIAKGKGLYGSLATSYDTGYENLTGVWTGTVPSYFLMDASIGYDFGKGLSVDMSATNLTDVLYRPMPYFPAQRRLLFVSVTYDLHHNILGKKK
jgi:outer membrane receptor for ferrienterochelin and colicins